MGGAPQSWFGLVRSEGDGAFCRDTLLVPVVEGALGSSAMVAALPQADESISLRTVPLGLA